MTQFRKSLKGNKLVLISFFILNVALFADLESYAPGGVNYGFEIKEKTNSYIKIRTYGSQVINCKRKNETTSSIVGFGVSDHTGLKFNIAYTFRNFQYKTENMNSWNIHNTDHESIGSYVDDYKLYISNLNNLKGNNDYLYLRLVYRKANYSCVNMEQSQNGESYWMHSYLMAGENSIGGDGINDTFEELERFLIWDGSNLFENASIVLDVNQVPLTGENKTSWDVTVKIFDELHNAEYYNGLGVDDLFLQAVCISSSNKNIDLSDLIVNRELDGFSDVVGGNDSYCQTTFNMSVEGLDDLDINFYKFSLAVYLNSFLGQVSSNMEYASLGNGSRGDTFYKIYYSVTSDGTINADLYQVQRMISGGKWNYTCVVDSGVTWTIQGKEFSESHLAYNPYNSDSSRDVPKIINLKCNYNYVDTWTNVMMPSLGESKDSEINRDDVINKDEIPDEESKEKGEDDFINSEDLKQNNDLLNEILKEFRNSRDENVEFYKSVLDFMDIEGGDRTPSVKIEGIDMTDENMEGVVEGIENGLGDALGSNGYGEGVSNGFGNGLGENLNQFKNLTNKDMSFTIDLRGCENMFPSVDCSTWIWNFSLYPDTSTEVGQGIERIVTVYVRPLFLFFLWLILGINCVKDISSFFGNNSNV